MMDIIRVAMWTMIAIVLYTFTSCMQNIKAAPLNENQIWCWAQGWEYNHKVYIDYREPIIIPCISPDMAIFNSISKAEEYHIYYRKEVGQVPAVRL